MADSCVWMDSGVEALKRQLTTSGESRQEKVQKSFLGAH